MGFKPTGWSVTRLDVLKDAIRMIAQTVDAVSKTWNSFIVTQQLTFRAGRCDDPVFVQAGSRRNRERELKQVTHLFSVKKGVKKIFEIKIYIKYIDIYYIWQNCFPTMWNRSPCMNIDVISVFSKSYPRGSDLCRKPCSSIQQQAFAVIGTIVATSLRTVGFSSRSGNIDRAEHDAVALATGDQGIRTRPRRLLQYRQTQGVAQSLRCGCDPQSL